MKKFINTINVEVLIENRRKELGITYEELGTHLGYTKSGIRKLIKESSIRCDILEQFCIILKADFFNEISTQLYKGKANTFTSRQALKDNALKGKVDEYREKYIDCLEERATISNELKESTLYINRCEMLLVKNNIPLPNK